MKTRATAPHPEPLFAAWTRDDGHAFSRPRPGARRMEELEAFVGGSDQHGIRWPVRPVGIGVRR